MKNWFTRVLLAGLLATCASIPVIAENRALLIGVGSYQNPKHNLPGIDLDVAMMKDTALLMGFKPHQIKIVMDRQATTANVKSTIQQWLVDGVSPGDQALVYYSGHGSQVPDQNNDEKDRSDEVLTMYELDVLYPANGQNTLTGVLLDDDLNALLNDINTENLIVMIDACHSGTATKSFSFNTRSAGVPDAVEKFIRYNGMPLSVDSQFDQSDTASGKQSAAQLAGTRSTSASKNNYVALAAARDDEKSLATSRGSLFTLGVKKAVADAAASKRPLSAGELVRKVDGFIGKVIKDPNRRFHPQLTGSNEKLIQVASAGQVRVNRQNVMNLVNSAAVQRMQFKPNRDQYQIGDKLELEIDVPVDGYLNVVVIDAEDVATVLFPNRFHPENRVSAGKMQLVRDSNKNIPAGKRRYSLPAGKPYGDTLLAVYVTEKPVNWYKDGDGEWDDLGNMKNAFAALGTKSTMASRGGFSAVAETSGNEKFGAFKSVQVKP